VGDAATGVEADWTGLEVAAILLRLVVDIDPALDETADRTEGVLRCVDAGAWRLARPLATVP
jgi:hypothetical protein